MTSDGSRLRSGVPGIRAITPPPTMKAMAGGSLRRRAPSSSTTMARIRLTRNSYCPAADTMPACIKAGGWWCRTALKPSKARYQASWQRQPQALWMAGVQRIVAGPHPRADGPWSSLLTELPIKCPQYAASRPRQTAESRTQRPSYWTNGPGSAAIVAADRKHWRENLHDNRSRRCTRPGGDQHADRA